MTTEYEIPKQCKAGVVVNEGPDFKVEVQMVDVPEPGMLSWELMPITSC
jgi:propanol-preferring alcohol dehydrogenase